MIAEKPDNFLLSELISGNERAFEKIFKDHYSSLCRYANSLVQDQDKAQSLAHNVYMKLWENRTQLGEVRSVLRKHSVNFVLFL